MKRIAMLSVCVISLLCGSSAMAGIGPYFGFNYSMLDDSGSGDVTINHYVFGLAVDTNRSEDTLFNYRFNIGFDLADMSVSWRGLSDSEMGYGFDMKHTFGFGIIRNSVVRLWAGPAVGLNFNVFLPERDNIYAVGGGAGPVIGANFHLRENFSLGATFGYMYCYSAYIVGGIRPTEVSTGSSCS
jgi:hypothetical protein